MRSVGFLLIMIWSCQAIAQSTGLIITDAKNGEGISFAHIRLVDLNNGRVQQMMSSEKGQVNIQEFSVAHIQVTAVGYQSFSDTLAYKKSLSIPLQPTNYEMDEIVVTGQYEPQAVDKSIYKVDVLSQKEIDQRAAQNLSDLMKNELNVRNTRDGALGSSMSIRGLSGENVKILVDGVPLIGRMNGNIDLDQVNLQNAGHVEIIEGPMSVIYGSNALAGVVNVISKKYVEQKANLNLNSYFESVGVYNISASGFKRWNHTHGELAVTRNFFSGFGEGTDDRYLTWKPKRQYIIDGKGGWKKNRWTVNGGVQLFHEELQDKGRPLGYYADRAFDKYFYTRRAIIRSDISKQMGDDHKLDILASYTFYDRIKNTYLKNLVDLSEVLVENAEMQDTSSFNNFMIFSTFANKTGSKFYYQAGLNLSLETGSGKRIENNQQEIGDYAFFLSGQWKARPNLVLQPGLRIIYNTKYAAPLVYALNIKYDITENTNLRASIARGFRSPSLKELYLDFVDVNHNIQGNEQLQAENSYHLNGSITSQTNRDLYSWGFEINGFYNYIFNLINLVQIPGNDELLYSYVNVDEFASRGAELFLSNQIYPWLRFKTGISYTDRKYSFDQEGEWAGSTDFITQVHYTWSATKLRFSVYYTYNGSYPSLIQVDEGNNPSWVFIDSFQNLDITLNRYFWKNRLNLQLGAKNLFDNTFVNQPGAETGGIHSGGGQLPVDWGRTFFVRLQLNISQY